MNLGERSGPQLSDLSVKNCDISFSFRDRQCVPKKRKERKETDNLQNHFLGFRTVRFIYVWFPSCKPHRFPDSISMTRFKLKLSVCGNWQSRLARQTANSHEECDGGEGGELKFQSNFLGLTTWSHRREDGNGCSIWEEQAFPSFALCNQRTDPQNEGREGRLQST